MKNRWVWMLGCVLWSCASQKSLPGSATEAEASNLVVHEPQLEALLTAQLTKAEAEGGRDQQCRNANELRAKGRPFPHGTAPLEVKANEAFLEAQARAAVACSEWHSSVAAADKLLNVTLKTRHQPLSRCEEAYARLWVHTALEKHMRAEAREETPDAVGGALSQQYSTRADAAAEAAGKAAHDFGAQQCVLMRRGEDGALQPFPLPQR